MPRAKDVDLSPKPGCFSYSTMDFLQVPGPLFSVFHPHGTLKHNTRLPLLPFSCGVLHVMLYSDPG